MSCEHLKSESVNEKADLNEDGYAIYGCCGGGCYIIYKIKYCPFCGELLIKEVKHD